MKLVSIYIVNHNYGHFLEDALNSLSKYFDDEQYEVLLFDNGSTDNSNKIINKFEHKIDQVYLQENIGLTATCNKALKVSSGKYLIRLDADDYFNDLGIEKLLKLAENENLDLCFGNYEIINSNGVTIKKVQRVGIKDNRVLHRPSHGACTLVRKEFLKSQGGYFNAFDRQDGYDLWLKAIYYGKIGFSDDVIFKYRNHGNNLTSNWDSILLTRRSIKKMFFQKKIQIIDPILYKIDLRNINFNKNDFLFFKERVVNFQEKLRQVDKFLVITNDENISSFCKHFKIDVSLLNEKHDNLSKIIVNIEDPILNIKSSAIQEAIVSSYIFKAGVCITAKEINKDNLYKYSSNGLEKYLGKTKNDALDKELEDMYYKTNGFTIENHNFSKQTITYVQIPDTQP